MLLMASIALAGSGGDCAFEATAVGSDAADSCADALNPKP